MRIVIVGAGAIGGYIGARLAREGADVVLHARGPHLEAMRTRGLRVVGSEDDFDVRPQVSGDLAAIGPAEDGGYWLIALRTPMPDLFAPLDWGTDRVFAATMGRFAALGVLPAVLDRLADLDRPEDLARWPELTA